MRFNREFFSYDISVIFFVDSPLDFIYIRCHMILVTSYTESVSQSLSLTVIKRQLTNKNFELS